MSSLGLEVIFVAVLEENKIGPFETEIEAIKKKKRNRSNFFPEIKIFTDSENWLKWKRRTLSANVVFLGIMHNV